MRKCYQFGEIKVDIDEAEFEGLTYRVAEFELIVSSSDEIPEAEKKIGLVLQNMGLDLNTIIPAKLTYFLYYKRQQHYNALVSGNVIKPIKHLQVKESV